MRAPASSASFARLRGRRGSGSGSGLRLGLGLGRRGGRREVLRLRHGLRGGHRIDVADLRLQRGQPVGDPLAARAQAVEQGSELALERVELGQHALGGLLHARDVGLRLASGVLAHVRGAALGGLEDQPDLLDVPADSEAAGRARGRRPLLAQALDLVRDAPQVRVDGRLVVSAAPDREVAPLDVLSLHGAQDTSTIRARPAAGPRIR